MVYRARDRIQDKYVAVKLLHPHLRRDPSFVQRFRREADLAMRLDSRHVVQVLATGKDGNDDYLVMELVEGADLTDIIRARGPLPEATVVSYASQIARAAARRPARRPARPARPAWLPTRPPACPATYPTAAAAALIRSSIITP